MNVVALRSLLPRGCQMMAVVKAQAYGHGAVAVARVAAEAGVTWLGVARVAEGVQLREAGLSLPILVLGPIERAELGEVVKADLRPTLVSADQARAVSRAAVLERRVVNAHIKLDTGMGRYGAELPEVRGLLGAAAGLPGLRLEGLYSHFATADDPDGSYAARQLNVFKEGRTRLKGEGFHFSLVHMAASGALLGVDGSHMDMVRVGIALCGLYPEQHLVDKVVLKPALSLHARVARVFQLKPGQSAGYGRTFIARKSTIAALVPVGYADGLPRSHSNQGFVLINGQRAPLIGRVSMDQCVADVSNCQPVGEGDPVVLIGSQGGEAITCDEFAQRSGTISYETLTSLGARVPRVYIRGDAPVAVAHLDQGRLEVWTH